MSLHENDISNNISKIFLHSIILSSESITYTIYTLHVYVFNQTLTSLTNLMNEIIK